MISVVKATRTYPSMTVIEYDTKIKTVHPGKVVDVDIITGTKSELKEHFKSKILPYREERYPDHEFPYLMEYEGVSVDRTLDYKNVVDPEFLKKFSEPISGIIWYWKLFSNEPLKLNSDIVSEFYKITGE